MHGMDDVGAVVCRSVCAASCNSFHQRRGRVVIRVFVNSRRSCGKTGKAQISFSGAIWGIPSWRFGGAPGVFLR